MPRALIVDDSATSQEILREILESNGLEVVGVAANADEALAETLRLQPDVITMDIVMPGENGFDATRRIMAERSTPIVIVSALETISESDAVSQALTAGALTVVRKPTRIMDPNFQAEALELAMTVKVMARALVGRHGGAATAAAAPTTAAAPSPPEPAAEPAKSRARLSAVAIVAEAGGPSALLRLLKSLDGFRAPIFVVQHLARGFVHGVAKQLDEQTTLRVKIAENGESIRASTVYVAPDNRHLEVKAEGRIALSSSGPINGLRPSATALFRSVAMHHGRGAVAIVLTGRGNDGIPGLDDIREAGGGVIALHDSSAVVPELPRAAASRAHLVLPLEEIAERLRATDG